MVLASLLLLSLLGILLFNTACAESRRARVIAGSFAMAWGSVLFLGSSYLQGFNHNIWYSGAAAELLDRTIRGIEANRADETAVELRSMRKRLSVTYENRGNFKELAIETAHRLERLAPDAEEPAKSMAD